MRSRLRRTVWTCAVLAALWGHGPTALSQDAGEAQFLVSYAAVGPDVDEERDSAAGFIESLDARDGLAAQECARRAQDWSARPDNVPADRWVSLVLVGFRTRRDWVALMFDGPDGAVSFALRRPARSIQGPGTRRDGVEPGEGQLSCNAVKELAADFGNGYDARRAPDPARLLRVSVGAWENWKPAASGGLPGADEGDEDDMGAVVTQTVGPQDIAGATALALAAAWTAGWQPALGDAPRMLKLDLARGVQTYSIRVTLTGPEGKRTFAQENVPAEDIFLNLRLICEKLNPDSGLLDFARLGKHDVSLLGLNGTTLVCAADGALTAFDASSGEALWTIAPPERAVYRFAVRTDAASRTRLFRWDAGVQRIGEDGTPDPPTELAPASTWSFDTAPGGDIVVANGTALRAYREGAEVWGRDDAAPFTCGPTVCGDRVLIGHADGQVIALNLADGKPIWNAPCGVALDGPITAVAGLAITETARGRIVAIRPADGTVAWSRDAGDTLLAQPQLAGGRIIIASKTNRVEALDPATGEAAAEFQSPTWLTDVRALPAEHGGWVGCADLRGDITFLRPADLTPARVVPLETRPQPGMLFVPAMPAHWGGAGGLIGDETPALLVADEMGFLYLLAVPEPGGENR